MQDFKDFLVVLLAGLALVGVLVFWPEPYTEPLAPDEIAAYELAITLEFGDERN